MGTYVDAWACHRNLLTGPWVHSLYYRPLASSKSLISRAILLAAMILLPFGHWTTFPCDRTMLWARRAVLRSLGCGDDDGRVMRTAGCVGKMMKKVCTIYIYICVHIRVFIHVFFSLASFSRILNWWPRVNLPWLWNWYMIRRCPHHIP